jgi:hypothetical protein
MGHCKIAFPENSERSQRGCLSPFRAPSFISIAAGFRGARRRMSWLNKAGANAKAVMFKLKSGIEPIGQGPHELESQPSICGQIEILREADAIVSHFHHK